MKWWACDDRFAFLLESKHHFTVNALLTCISQILGDDVVHVGRAPQTHMKRISVLNIKFNVIQHDDVKLCYFVG